MSHDHEFGAKSPASHCIETLVEVYIDYGIPSQASLSISTNKVYIQGSLTPAPTRTPSSKPTPACVLVSEASPISQRAKLFGIPHVRAGDEEAAIP